MSTKRTKNTMYHMANSCFVWYLFVCLFIGSVAQLLPINEAPNGKGITREYIVVAKNKFDATHKEAEDKKEATQDQEANNITKGTNTFSDLLSEKYGIVSNKEYAIGTWRAVLVNLDSEMLEKLRADIGNIKLIDVNQQLKIHAESKHEDKQQNATCYGQKTGEARWGLGRISHQQLPNYTTATYKYREVDKNVDIYVLDTGVKVNHTEFNNGRAIWGNTVDGLKHEGDDDYNGHGTNVASIAAGVSFGVAKQAIIIAVKVLDERGAGYTSYTVEGLEWVYNRIQSQTTSNYTPKAVVSLSHGSDGPVPSLDAAVNAIIELGFQVVIAAGNNYVNACDVSPARVAAALTVGATDWKDRFPSFSNYGACLDVSAPGAAISAAGIGSNEQPSVMSGTSQAAPFVAGVVARYIGSHVPHILPAQISDFIISTATKEVISFPLPSSGQTTPNRLLYMACGEGLAANDTLDDTLDICDCSSACSYSCNWICP